MGKLIKLKKKPKKDTRIGDFLEELEILRTALLEGTLDNIFILAYGKDLKLCSSSRVTVKDSRSMCKDFIDNTKDYLD